MSLSEFINMGGHGFYVWSCYFVTLMTFVGLYVSAKLQHKNLINQIKRRYRRETLTQQTLSEKANLEHNLGEKKP